jgi:tetratricopeptide (TPR) repeat protein
MRVAALPRPGAVARALLVLALVLLPLVGQAADRPAVLRMRAERLAAEDRCGEAIELLEQARMTEPEGARLALLRGRCEIRLQRYGDAVESLVRAREEDPALQDVDLYLGVAAFHLGELEAAEAALERARGRTSDQAQLDLYTGLVLLQRAKHRDAALALERARRASPETVEPVASHYAGLAWQYSEERVRAEEALARVIERDPEGPWGTEARKLLEVEELEPPGRAWVELSAGLEYDSNVVQLGEHQAATGISDEGDFRGVWTAEGGAELFRNEDGLSGGVVGAYTGSAHFESGDDRDVDLNDFDIHHPVVSLWLDREIDERSLMRLRYDAGYAWVGYEDFRINQAVTASGHYLWGRAGESGLSTTLFWNDYRFGLPHYARRTTLDGVDVSGRKISRLDRDGVGAGVRLDHRVEIKGGPEDTWVRGSYGFNRYSADGRDWDYWAHEVLLGFETRLPLDLAFDAAGSFTYQPFDSFSSFDVIIERTTPRGRVFLSQNTGDRDDQIWRASVSLSRAINQWLSLSAQYSFIDNASDVDAYDHTRHIAGVYATVRIQ